VTRGRLTRRRALAVGGAGAVAAVVGAGAARSAPERAEADALGLLLALERAQEAFYLLAARALEGDLRRFAAIAADQDAQHAALLGRAARAGAAAAPLAASAAAITRDARRFAAAAVALEDAVVGAYTGQAANLGRDGLARAASIASVHARRAEWIRDLAGVAPARAATGTALAAPAALAALRQAGLLA